MDMTAIIQSILGAAAGAVGAYVAIRTDLAALKARMDIVERSSDQAHSRIDNILSK